LFVLEYVCSIVVVLTGKLKGICGTESGMVSVCQPRQGIKMHKQSLENMVFKINIKIEHIH